jgi:hypothetical protein
MIQNQTQLSSAPGVCGLPSAGAGAVLQEGSYGQGTHPRKGAPERKGFPSDLLSQSTLLTISWMARVLSQIRAASSSKISLYSSRPIPSDMSNICLRDGVITTLDALLIFQVRVNLKQFIFSPNN